MENYYNLILQNSKVILMLPGEKVILHRRQHKFSVIIPIVIASLLGGGFMAVVFLGLAFFYQAFSLLVVSWGVIIAGTLSLITKSVIDWYLHIYIVTNRRILEIRYKPFFSQDVNDVLLDQVRCTEVDVQIRGYIHGLMDIGDIIITFDRPTHQNEFVLHDIQAPRKIGTLLGHLLNTPQETPKDMDKPDAWYREIQSDEGKSQYVITEQLFPRSQFSPV